MCVLRTLAFSLILLLCTERNPVHMVFYAIGTLRNNLPRYKEIPDMVHSQPCRGLLITIITIIQTGR